MKENSYMKEKIKQMILSHDREVVILGCKLWLDTGSDSDPFYGWKPMMSLASDGVMSSYILRSKDSHPIEENTVILNERIKKGFLFATHIHYICDTDKFMVRYHLITKKINVE